MKFLSTTITAVFAGISLLVPTAYGNLQYRCEIGDPITESQVLETVNKSFLIDNSPQHPAIPTTEPHKTYFSTRPWSGSESGIASFLIQVYGQPPKYQVYQGVARGWRLCTLENGN
ncbi:BgTH12-04706 [Blumeria graminis f. sp. triticale]|uniref:BgtE-20033 n=3 Tax=Blumeria graminis TaxID=34373 RepID=A0A381L051_BLUGR|nr:BgTH12-04706 [Blumeria graminis f. sp. triticale]VCU39192.1 BgtE-20033 [Blumeria graminis f. sp. tritici]